MAGVPVQSKAWLTQRTCEYKISVDMGRYNVYYELYFIWEAFSLYKHVICSTYQCIIAETCLDSALSHSQCP